LDICLDGLQELADLLQTPIYLGLDAFWDRLGELAYAAYRSCVLMIIFIDGY